MVKEISCKAVTTAPPRLRLRRPPVTDRIRVDLSERVSVVSTEFQDRRSPVQAQADGAEPEGAVAAL